MPWGGLAQAMGTLTKHGVKQVDRRDQGERRRRAHVEVTEKTMFDMLAVAQQLTAGGAAREQAEPFERSGPGSALR